MGEKTKVGSKFRLYQHTGESSKRPDLDKKEQMRGLWQQHGMFLCYITHREWWRLLYVQHFSTCIFQLEKVHFTVPPAHFFYSLPGAGFSLSNRKISFCLLQLHHFPKKQFRKEENEGTVTEDPWKVSKPDVGAGGHENRAIHFIGFI